MRLGPPMSRPCLAQVRVQDGLLVLLALLLEKLERSKLGVVRHRRLSGTPHVFRKQPATPCRRESAFDWCVHPWFCFRRLLRWHFTASSPAVASFVEPGARRPLQRYSGADTS